MSKSLRYFIFAFVLTGLVLGGIYMAGTAIENTRRVALGSDASVSGIAIDSNTLVADFYGHTYRFNTIGLKRAAGRAAGYSEFLPKTLRIAKDGLGSLWSYSEKLLEMFKTPSFEDDGKTLV